MKTFRDGVPKTASLSEKLSGKQAVYVRGQESMQDQLTPRIRALEAALRRAKKRIKVLELELTLDAADRAAGN